MNIEVVVNRAATIPTPSATLVVDQLELIARFSAKPNGETATIRVATTEPACPMPA